MISSAFRRFAALESAAGILLLGFALLALAWANSSWADLYFHLREFALPVQGLRGTAKSVTVEFLVNDALMAVFFLLVGLEIKRELVAGELNSLRRAALPAAGALGGMLVPAAIFIAWNSNGPAHRGWGIPMATDIAFALGVITLLGKRVPAGLKVFLAALAILDDLGAILVIALFYSGEVHFPALAAAGAIVAGLLLLNRAGVRRRMPYLIAGPFLWAALLLSGLHATLAGVLLAFCIPHGGAASADEASPSEKIETTLGPWVNFAILPLFALVNAGIALSPRVTGTLLEPLGLGIVLGLCLGKPLGITFFSWLAVRLRFATLPANVRWPHLLGAGILGGIGFTMSIFIAGLGLPDRALLNGAKLAVLAASSIAGIVGCLVLRLSGRMRPS
ncbi:MAG TPA: Na+/H+ antiporter NhaA [Fibrobacteria bacterium]|nr:Na+/H+ antiporter NhaA [Fibrobacteria bacterium]